MKHSIAPLLIFTLLVPALASAGPAEDKGLEIAKEADSRDEGFGDSRSEMVMILRNKRGQESKRELEIRTLEVKGDGDKSMTVFHTPRDVRGTAMLTFSHPVEADEQWLYLPALRRVKRIASNNKSGPFMGSEFAYEDFASQEIEKYTYKYLKDEKVDGVDCFLTEQYPVSKDSGYTKLQAWIDKDEYRMRKIDFYDRKGKLLKTLTPTEYKQYLGKHWRAHKLNKVNQQTGKSTELIWSEFKFKTGLKDGDFTRTRLQQVL
jgi:outer membrane lipoprotein-sorting protein